MTANSVKDSFARVVEELDVLRNDDPKQCLHILRELTEVLIKDMRSTERLLAEAPLDRNGKVLRGGVRVLLDGHVNAYGRHVDGTMDVQIRLAGGLLMWVRADEVWRDDGE